MTISYAYRVMINKNITFFIKLWEYLLKTLKKKKWGLRCCKLNYKNVSSKYNTFYVDTLISCTNHLLEYFLHYVHPHRVCS
jgi:hypothetical protein